ncbi:oxaloacetate decarboxylase alpha chain [Neisseria perflava]|uniref:oxaloacetate decarboxylase alpha chain n=1 Tax=Neisseria perflava TaxID=33053 RepID=UPI0020A0D227|nr:oxaloacetate decarboxylase alpha chain [Neisseria perflava]MCP1659337.1 hypothetical protein [Neisseria perflava]
MTQKSNPQALGLLVSDILQWEATPLTRVIVTASEGLKAGEFVEYGLRSKKYVALTDENNGTVIIQPHNCIINLNVLSSAAITAARTDLNTMQTEDDAYGIVYKGTPQA